MRYKIYKPNQIRIRDLDWKNSHKIQDGFIIKLYDNHTLVGNCYIVENWIYNLVINPKFRDKGYGSKLLKIAENVIIKKYKSVRLTPQDNNSGLREFYAKNGFVGFSLTEQEKHDGEKEYWEMWKHAKLDK